MKQVLFFLLFVALIGGQLHAKPVDVATARKVAATGMNAYGMKNPGALRDITATTPFTEFYVFASDNGGFILVSADDCVIPILGYSVDQIFNGKEIPENVRGVLDGYEAEIRYWKKCAATGTAGVPAGGVAAEWKSLASGQMPSEPLSSAVTALMETSWNQYPYYNALCPYDENETNTGNNHVVTGCVATATAQIMKYHNHPATGYGEHGYNHSTYGTLSANFAGTHYDWNNMPATLSSSSSATEVNAVATLMYHIGVADEMGYDLASHGGSSAYNYNYSSSSLAASSQSSLMQYFKYRPDMAQVFRDDYSNEEFSAILRAELDASRPILFSGSGNGGGHSFVCDGYTAGGKFHINWGWGGYFDGYFAMGHLNPRGGGAGSNSNNAYNNDICALIGIQPNNAWNTTDNTTVTAGISGGTATITGAGSFGFGSLVTLGVSDVAEGYRFAGWSDHDRSNPRLLYANGGNYQFTAIVEPLSGDTLSYCGNHCQHIANNSSNRWGIRLPASVLHAGDSLTGVQIFIYKAGTYTLTVYTGTSSPSTVAYTTTRAFAVDETGQWQTLVLTTPHMVGSNEHLWLVFTCSDASYPASLTHDSGNPDGILVGDNLTSLNNRRSFMIRGLFGLAAITPDESGDICQGVTAPYNLAFENADYDDMLACWTNSDADTDGYGWEFNDSLIISRSWWGEALTPDNWLISPDITLPEGGTYALTWKDRPKNTGMNRSAEHYGVFLNTNGSTVPADFTLLQEFTTIRSAEWNPRSIDLSSYAGQTVRLAFRHYNVTDKEALYLTALAVTAENAPEPVSHTVTAVAADNTMGTVTGGGSYTYGDTAILTATANDGYHFDHWSDGNTNNPRLVAVTQDTTFTALFVADPVVVDTDFIFADEARTMLKRYIGTRDTVVIPSTTVVIMDSAFLDNTTITVVVLPEGVTSIGQWAFGRCYGLTDANLPTTLTTLKRSAFHGCSSLTSISIPASVTEIGVETFSVCGSMVSMTVDPNNTVFDSRENCNAIIRSSDNTLVSGCGATIIPNSVTAIGARSFVGRDNLTSVTIPNSVTSIAPWAFYSCKYLTTVVLSDNVASIGDRAFLYCERIDSIVVSEGNPVYDSRNNCNAIIETATNTLVAGSKNTVIPPTVTAIGDGAFSGRRGITSITIPASVTYIGEVAFYFCYDLSEIHVLAAVPPTMSSGGVFSYITASLFVPCGSLSAYQEAFIWGSHTDIQEEFPYTVSVDSSEHGQVEVVQATCANPTATLTAAADEGYHFAQWSDGDTNNPRLVTVTSDTSFTAFFAKNPTYVDSDFIFADANHTQLIRYIGTRDTVEIPSTVVTIMDSAFYQNTNIKDITIPNSVTSIGDLVFAYCENLTSLSIPNSITTIGSYAFYQCTGLTFISIPNSVTSIGNDALRDCSSLTFVSIPNSVTTLGDRTFSGCTSLTSVTIGNSVTSIGNYAFYGCSSLTEITSHTTQPPSLGSYVFNYVPTTVIVKVPCGSAAAYRTADRWYDFANIQEEYGFTVSVDSSEHGYVEIVQATCDNPTATLTATADNGYRFDRWSDGDTNNPRLVAVTQDTTFAALFAADPVVVDTDFIFADEARTMLKRYVGTSDTVVIPSTTVTIMDSAFYQNTVIKSVTIPESVISIGNTAFSYCSSLTSAIIPNLVTSIGNSAFEGCSGLTSLTIPNSTTSIGDWTFAYCSGLISLTIGSSVTSIGNSSFRGCSGLSSLTIPNSVTSIGSFAFLGCSGLTSLTIPNSVTSISNSAFESCSGLTSLTIPNSITSIGNYVFRNCDGLTSVTIPNSVISIGYCAFTDCNGLTTVTIGSSVTSIGESAFYNCGGLTKITCLGITAPTLGSQVFYGVTNTIPVNIPCGSTASYQSAWSNFTNIQEEFGYTVSVDSSEHGAVEVVQPTCANPTATLTATAEEGYRFAQWSDGDTNNPRLVAVTQDTTFAALFVADPVVVDTDFIFADEARTMLKRYVGTRDTVVIPTTTVVIMDSAFLNRSDVKSVAIPEGVVSVGRLAFYNCTSLTAVELPGTVTTLGALAFEYCYRLTRLSLPTALTTIGDSAFYWCLRLDDVYAPSALPAALGTGVFDYGSARLTVYVPCGATEAYRTAWGTERSYSEGWTLHAVTATTNNELWGAVTVAYCYPTATLTATPARNYHFLGWSDGVGDNPRTVTPTRDTSFTALFAFDTFAVSLRVDSLVHGTCGGQGSYAYGEAATVTATPYSGYRFTHWSNGATYNPYTFAVVEDVELTAIFRAVGDPYQDTLVVHDTVTVHDTAFVDIHDTLTVRDTLVVHDTLTVVDTAYTIVHDTTRVVVYVHDTTLYNTYDTTICRHFVYDTTLVFDTMIVNLYTYDTSIYNNYRYDTVVINRFQYDTTVVTVFDTVINNHYQYDTTLVNIFDTVINNLYQYDTTLVNIFDTTLVNVFDTVINNLYQYDTTLVNIFDTVINNYYRYDTTIVHDTTVVNIFDTVINNYYRYDTTIVHDTTLVNIYDTVINNHYQYDTTVVNVYDTVINNLYQYDTTLVNVYDTVINNLYQYDTTLVNVYDTVINNLYQYDTTLVNVYDTVINNLYQYDTTVVTVYDTVINNLYQYDTTLVNVYDTVVNNYYRNDTVYNYYHDTVNNYYRDTVVITRTYHDTTVVNQYVYDTIYLYRYVFDTVYIHDTVYVSQEGAHEVALPLEVKLYQRDGNLVVEGAEGYEVRVYDAVGRMIGNCGNVGMRNCVSVGASATNTIAQSHNNAITFAVPASGVYLVKVGEAPARRVVVVR